MRNSSHQVVRSDVPEPPASGVRAIAGPAFEDPDVEADDDFDVERFVEDDDDALLTGDEGSFFGASDEAACNRVFRAFAFSSVRHGHGDDLLSRSRQGSILVDGVQRRRDRTIAARRAAGAK